MDKFKMMKKHIAKRHEADCCISALKDEIESDIRKYIEKTYIGLTVYLDDYDCTYKSSFVKIYYYPSWNYYNDLRIKIIFFACPERNKLSKKHRERIENEKKYFKERSHIRETNHKTPLWFYSEWECKVKDCLEKNLHLEMPT